MDTAACKNFLVVSAHSLFDLKHSPVIYPIQPLWQRQRLKWALCNVCLPLSIFMQAGKIPHAFCWNHRTLSLGIRKTFPYLWTHFEYTGKAKSHEESFSFVILCEWKYRWKRAVGKGAWQAILLGLVVRLSHSSVLLRFKSKNELGFLSPTKCFIHLQEQYES